VSGGDSNLYEQFTSMMEKFNAFYQGQANKHKKSVVFQLKDLVWINLRKKCFPSKHKSKLMPRAHGPFDILERANSNAYKMSLPRDFGVSATFNVAELSTCLEENHLVNLRVNPHQ